MLDNGRGIGEESMGTYLSDTYGYFGDYDAYTIDRPVADLHSSGHMFNRVKGVNYCACDCENCNGGIPQGKHYPACICQECECDG